MPFFPLAQGYVRAVESHYFCIFNISDHLGNIRVSYSQDRRIGKLNIVEENHYYPYGLKHQNYNISKLDYVPDDMGVVLASTSALQYKYKFNCIEFQEELGLNLYDMDFRDYDPAIGRWTGIDPVTHHSMSPYMAFDGNPVYWADPSGADAYSDAMTLFNYSGSGITRFTAEDNGSYTITSHTGNEQVKQALADLGFSENGEGNGGPNINFPDAKNYPRFNAMLGQLYDYVKNNPQVLYSLAYHSGYTEAEVLAQLEMNQGVDIVPRMFENRKKLGQQFSWGLLINQRFMNGLEIAKLDLTIQGTSFLLAVTVLHELVHYGRQMNGLTRNNYEYGLGFEIDAFGQEIWPHNANNLYQQNGWKFKY